MEKQKHFSHNPRFGAIKLALGLLVLTITACGGGASPQFDGNPNPASPGGQASSAAVSTPDPQVPSPPPSSTGNVSSVAPPPAPMPFDVAAASHMYAQQCASCHGDKGQGGMGGGLKTCTTCGHEQMLSKRIEETMPIGSPASCDTQCANLLAKYIRHNFPEPQAASSASSSSEQTNSSQEQGSSSSAPIIVPPPSSVNNSSANNPPASSASNSSANNPPASSASNSSANNPPASSASTVSSAASSNSAPAMGDPVAGAGRYATSCANCHGIKGESTFFPLDPSRDYYTHSSSVVPQSLANYISDWMPVGGESSCVGQCAEDIAAHIRTWVATSSSSAPASSSSSDGSNSSSQASSSGNQSSVSPPASSSGTSSSAPSTPVGCDIAYGPRYMRVLTRHEFVNSVRDLTGVDVLNDLGRSVYDALPADNMVGGFSNNVMASIESGALQSYSLVVSRIADHLAANNFASVVDCSDISAGQCGSRLIDDFGFRAFRRPLTDSERQVFQEMFTADYTGGDTKEGLKLAVRTLLTSPNFLYRDETGVSILDIENGGSDDPQYEPVGNVVTVFDDAVTPAYHAGINVSLAFSGTELLEVLARAEPDGQGNWPDLTVQVGGQDIVIPINASYNKVYRVVISGLVGNNNYFGFVAAGGNPSLVLEAVTIASARESEIPAPTVELDSDAYVLTPYQLASFLSFTFAGTTPDMALLEAARRNELSTREQISAQVERLLDTPQARAQFGNLAAQWLRTDRVLEQIKDPELYSHFTPAVREAMSKEIREIFNHVVLDEGEPFTSLYDGNFTFVNKALADFYGIGGVTGNQMQKVTGVGSRAGLVTSGAFLTVNAHEQETAPILRSVYARRAFLCHDVPEPPTGISLSGEDVDAVREEQRLAWEAYLEANGGLSTSRAKYEYQTSAPLCQTCHAEMINPLGAGFEDFDAVGLPQAFDFNNLMVEYDGVLHGVTSVNDSQQISFEGAKEFAHEIAGLDVTRQCFIDNTFRLAMGTGAKYFAHGTNITLSSAERASYSCEATRLDQVMRESGFSTRELLKAIGSMDSVRYRKNVTR